MAQDVIGGLTVGAVYALVALGMALVYSVSRVINLAQGGFVILAGLLAVKVAQDLHLSTLPTVVIVVAGMVVVVGVVDLVVIRPAIHRATREGMLLVTVGLLQAVGGVLLVGWGNYPYTMRPWTGQRAVAIGSLRVPTQTFWVLGALAVSVLVLWLALERTKTGLALRATAENPDGARLSGVNVDRMRTLAFMVGGGFAALAGVSVIPVTFVSYNTVIPYAIDGFIAAVFGGLAGIWGAVVGGLALGVVEGVAQRYVSGPVAQVLALSVFLLVLLVRPSGLAGPTVAVRR